MGAVLRRWILALSIAALAMSAVLVQAAKAQGVAGDWVGTMTTQNTGALTLALHLKAVAAGYEGTLDTIELGSKGVAVKVVTATPDKLALEIPSVRGRFEGSWDAAARQWSGTWTTGSGQGYPVRFVSGLPPPPVRVEGLDGDWQGALNGGPAGLLRLAIHIRTGADGTYATLDSIDQGVNGVPIMASRAGREVTFDMRALRATFVADLSEDGSRLQGEFSQGGALMPLVMTRSADGPSALAVAPTISPPPTTWSVPDEATIRALLARRIEVEHRGVGMVVGTISPKGRRIVAYGGLDAGGPPVTGATLFEIGSITKIFTSLLLEDMVLKGEVGLDDPVSKYLPADVRVPTRNGKAITLRQLATHTSGLPRDFTHIKAQRLEDIYAGADEAQLYKLLNSYELSRDPGAEWSYSNLGVGLLGVALSRRTGEDLPTLIRQRITGPLKMPATTMDVTAIPKGRLAIGHDADLRPTAPFPMGPAVAGAGAIRSSADEMLNLLEAELGYRRSPLAAAMSGMLSEDRPGMAGMRQALGWMTLDTPSGRIVTHSGGTIGQRAFTAFNPTTRQGVVVLSNSEGVAGADDIGLFVIAGVPVRPLPPAPPPRDPRQPRPEVALTAEAAAPYLGRYRFSRSITTVVGYEAGRLTLQSIAADKAGPAVPLVFHGGGAFSLTMGDADLAFQLDAAGHAAMLVFRGAAGEFQSLRTPG
ncbi:MAG: beta-lactamase family protein [Alphaproteobacteria bacterium]|nr:beta-lactamase family protein [Alphaproteobacteria bacterium]MBU1516346.1 beta-lactamase family protein [Alphaproteobacteria bacterium]MBU2093417.1 beta-lactamase family protein [Alphaproteobacteria bacterium]MBU2153904.1 beta-lactamase family protein [Alphaproteobacteria bacterium]MBU2307776.1 beta-lactamase family protein [Alphaproteobacteria bacterium]